MSKLFDKKDVFSWSNCEEARQYIGEEGYFCDTYHENLAAWHKGLLQDVDLSMTVECIFEDEENEVFGLFLPAEKVRHAKKKVRSFKNIKEFLKYFQLGTSLQYRKKGIKTINVYAIVSGVIDILNGGDVILGNEQLSLYELFSEFEYLDNLGNWQVFGVEEEDGI